MTDCVLELQKGTVPFYSHLLHPWVEKMSLSLLFFLLFFIHKKRYMDKKGKREKSQSVRGGRKLWKTFLYSTAVRYFLTCNQKKWDDDIICFCMVGGWFLLLLMMMVVACCSSSLFTPFITNNIHKSNLWIDCIGIINQSHTQFYFITKDNR